MSQPVTISYNDLLKSDTTPLHDAISAAFGSQDDALGIILVSDLPSQWPKLRETAMRAAARFAQSTPEEVRNKYTDAESSYSFGWSHGKESMNGKPDIMKGSYYANPATDHPSASAEQRVEHATYLRDNIWPSADDCPGYEDAFKALAGFMVQVALRLAKACDHLVAQHSTTASIESMIRESQCSKARLLHYYPPTGQVIDAKARHGTSASSKSADERLQNGDGDDYCGTHLDHSLLTALCPAMYLFHASDEECNTDVKPLQVPAPTADAGLYIKSRNGKTVKAAIPPNCMAFQTGEALQLLTQGRLQATPHYVSAGGEGTILPQVYEAIEKSDAAKQGSISRSTMAVFLQPDVNAVIGQDGETFGHFTRRIIAEHY